MVCDPWADPNAALREYGVKLVKEETVAGTADCVIVAVGHKEYRGMSMMKIKELFSQSKVTSLHTHLPSGSDGSDGGSDWEKVLIDVKSLYRIDELRASRLRFWRL